MRASIRDPLWPTWSSWPYLDPDSERARNHLHKVSWNPATVSLKKLCLRGTIDPIVYYSRLLALQPQAEPALAAADEEHAYRNWVTLDPDATNMVVVLQRTLRAWRDFALCFQVKGGSVCGDNRVRLMI